MYIGGLISLLAASIVGTIYTVFSYLNYKTLWICEFQEVTELISPRIQWMKTTADLIGCVFYYEWSVLNLLFLFRPHQLLFKLLHCVSSLSNWIFEVLFTTILDFFQHLRHTSQHHSLLFKSVGIVFFSV